MLFAILMALWSIYATKMGLKGTGPNHDEPYDSNFRLHNQSIAKMDPPHLIRDDYREKSFQTWAQTDVRLPHGPNPHSHELNSWALFNNPFYMKRYQHNIHELRVKNQDWRLDDNMNSSLNNYNNVHMPEDLTTIISNYHSQRHSQREAFEKPHTEQLSNH